MGIALTRPSWMDETQLIIYRGLPIIFWMLYRGAGCVITPVAKELLFFNETFASSLRSHHITSASHDPVKYYIEEQKRRNRECPQTRLKENFNCPVLLSGTEHGRHICYTHVVPAVKRNRLVQFPGDPEVYILRNIVPHKPTKAVTECKHPTEVNNNGMMSHHRATEVNYVTDQSVGLPLNRSSSGLTLDPVYSLVVYSSETLASASEMVLNRDTERSNPVTIKCDTKATQDETRNQKAPNEKKRQTTKPKSTALQKKEIKKKEVPSAVADDVVRALGANAMDRLMEVPFNRLPFRYASNY